MFVTIVTKLFVGMIGILFFLRITGKTQMANLTPLDTVNTIVLGAIIGGVMYSPDTSVWMLVYGILVWTLLNIGLRYLMRWNIFDRIVNGKDETLIADGKVNLKILKRNNLGIDQFRAKLREMEIYSLKDVKEVRFETDGKFTIFKNRDDKESFLLISGGGLVEDEMKRAGLAEEWLRTEIGKLGYDGFKEIFAAEWTPSRGFYVIGKDGKIIDKTLEEDPRHKEVNREAQAEKEY